MAECEEEKTSCFSVQHEFQVRTSQSSNKGHSLGPFPIFPLTSPMTSSHSCKQQYVLFLLCNSLTSLSLFFSFFLSPWVSLSPLSLHNFFPLFLLFSSLKLLCLGNRKTITMRPGVFSYFIEGRKQREQCEKERGSKQERGRERGE